MYYAAKGLELLGITLIGIGFYIKFPTLMDPKLLLNAVQKIFFTTFTP